MADFGLITERKKWQWQLQNFGLMRPGNLVGHMKTSEFKRFLASKGATFVEGTKHTKIYLDGKQSLLPRHSKELGEGLRRAILRQLQIKE
ncbi:MAG TPA: type II toxin-antitoxin system HicA family toxin [Variovorax sp.]